jgi:hypothetical protein
MGHEVNGLSNLCFSVGKRRLIVAAHYEICKARKGLVGRVRMDRGQRSRMNGIERIEQSPGLNFPDFSEEDLGNLRVHFRCLGERFIGNSISANSTPHKQVVGTD